MVKGEIFAASTNCVCDDQNVLLVRFLCQGNAFSPLIFSCHYYYFLELSNFCSLVSIDTKY